MRRALTILVFAIGLAAQTKYSGPKPDKKDVPYLVHAANLVQTEIVHSTPKEDGDRTTWSVPGESSLAKTPLALPIFLIDAASIAPLKLRLYAFEQKGGRRELTLNRNGSTETDPILLTISNVSGTLYRIELVNEIPNGEYGLTVPGSNQFFCFSVF
jgi:hypothetical protein